MGLSEEFTGQISGHLAREREAMLIAAAREIAGYDETMYDLAPRGTLTLHPDGTEVFSFDGIPLLKFWPIEVEQVQEGHAFKVKATRRVQRLNTDET